MSSEAEVTVQGVLSRLPSSSAPCGPAAGDEIGEPTGEPSVGGDMVGVGARRPTRLQWASCGGRGTSHCANFGRPLVLSGVC